MNSLVNADVLKEYVIQDVVSDDEELKDFLFTLGCYSGEKVTVVSKDRNNLTVALKDARYNIDNDLAAAVLI